jgi:polysaccharide biosynthesis transport protein
MDLRSYMRLLARRWPVFVITTLLVGGLLGGASFLIPPVYTAQAQVFVSARVASDATLDERRVGAMYIDERVRGYAALVTTETVLGPVIDDLRLPESVDDLAAAITAEIPADTTVLRIKVTDEDARRAASIADAIVTELPDAIATVEGAASPEASPVVGEVVQPAEPPTRRTSPNLRLNLAIAALLGLCAGVFVAVLSDTFDSRIRRGAHVTPLGVPFLGGVRIVRTDDARTLVDLSRQDKDVADAYREIATDAMFRAGSAPATLLFTSVRPGAGKTVLAANVAAALAEAGNRVVYVDADLRGGSLATQARLPATRGLTELLTGRRTLAETLAVFTAGGFSVIPSGNTSININEMLAGDRMAWLLTQLEESFDVIVVDAPPVTTASEAARFTQNLPNVVVVAESGHTRRGDLAKGLGMLRQAGANVLGVVLSRVSRAEESAPVTGSDDLDA